MSQIPLASLVFAPDGTACGLYNEAIELWRLGRLRVRRATRVLAAVNEAIVARG